MTPPDFTRLLVPGARVTTVCGPATVAEPLRAELSLPSGELVASAWRWEPVGFTETAPPGRYPVLLHPVVLDRGDPERPVSVAVQLVIRDEPAVSWTLALLPGQDPADLSETGFFGFPVDGGEASLIDARYLRELSESGTLDEFIADATADLGFGGLMESTEDEDGRDAVMFKTGDGDGVYPTWIGRTAGGDLACFVVDFLLLDEPGQPDESDESDQPRPSRQTSTFL
ncbi:Protein of unknown function (DUF4241) [Goodfellowiella coeruleoviolacea]|uniref:DUF4241 domain-containing protein n=2 Tax=Goodfellowiella coeruleoviolacea TaxID=334858 RepID=A0AAE3KL50_9PSEU|nr:Protein of unknown function (DUF4241) [Goodfellowiella coeruleoviolacea]